MTGGILVTAYRRTNVKFWKSVVGGILIGLAFGLMIGAKLAGREDFGGADVVPSLLLVIAGVPLAVAGKRSRE
jgi:hypothetical protein